MSELRYCTCGKMIDETFDYCDCGRPIKKPHPACVGDYELL